MLKKRLWKVNITHSCYRFHFSSCQPHSGAAEQQNNPRHTLEDKGHTNNGMAMQPTPRDRLEELWFGPEILQRVPGLNYTQHRWAPVTAAGRLRASLSSTTRGMILNQGIVIVHLRMDSSMRGWYHARQDGNPWQRWPRSERAGPRGEILFAERLKSSAFKPGTFLQLVFSH